MTGKAGAAIGVVATLVVLGIVATTSFRATGGMRADVHPGKTETTLANWVADWYISHAAPRRLNPWRPQPPTSSSARRSLGEKASVNPRQTWLMANLIRSLNSHQTGRH